MIVLHFIFCSIHLVGVITIDYLVEYEIKVAKEVIDHIHPDALFHHDDWGSQKSSFLSPEMFDEFLLPAYEKIYGYCHRT